MVSLRKSLTVSLLIPMFFSGVGAQDWGVYYYPNSICALKGSTVTMGCTYTYPTRYTVQNKFWTKSWPVGGSEPTGLSGDSQYIGDTQQDCSLRLKNITAQDKGVYYFRFLTDKGGKWQGKGGVDLSVTDLQVEVPERVIEGDNVTLICKTTCSLTVGTIFTWYRNGAPLSSRTDQLYLQSVSREDAGSYHCAVVGQKLSPEVTLNVLYGPKNITVSISPSGEIVEGNSVTLTCSSDANPPVQKYTWFKGTSLVATGETFTIKNISSENSGGYKCRSSNEQGEKYSDTVTLNVLYPPKNVSASISPSGEIVEGSSVNLTCSSDGNPSVQNYIWFKKVDKEVLQKWTNQIYSITNISSDDCGEYQCIATNTHGSRSSEYKSINVSYAPKNVLVSSSETLNGSMVTLTCSCDANPPVQNYTWFKEGEGSPVGSGHSYSAVQSGSYYCVAQNTYGSRIAAAKMVRIPSLVNKESIYAVLYAVLGVAIFCGCILVIAAVCLRRKRQKDAADDADKKKENVYSNVAVISAACETTPDPNQFNQDGIHYASIKHPRNAGSSAVKASSSGTDEEVQYASVQHRQDEETEKADGNNVKYASLRFARTGAPDRSAASPLEGSSVIYSSVN